MPGYDGRGPIWGGGPGSGWGYGPCGAGCRRGGGRGFFRSGWFSRPASEKEDLAEYRKYLEDELAALKEEEASLEKKG